MVMRNLAKNQFQEIADLYNLGVVKDVLFFSKGLQTPKAVLKTQKGTFVVSQHSVSKKKSLVHKTIASLQCEMYLLETLYDFPTPHYKKSRNKKYIEAYKNIFLTCYTFLEGTNPTKINKKKAYALGKFLGAFHKQAKTFDRGVQNRRKFYVLTNRRLQQMSRYVDKNKGRLREVSNEIKEGVKRNRLAYTLPRGPVHVDVKPENELFIGDTLTGVIDFGNFYIDAYVLDIGKMIMWNCVKNGIIDISLFRSVVEGYETSRKLSKQEKENMKKAILYALYSHIWVDLYHVPLNYVPRSYTTSLLKEFLPVARWLEQEDVAE